MYWDIATHIDSGRDEGPFANASHYFILVGLFGIFAAGLIAIFMPDERPSRSAVPIPGAWDAPLGGVLILLCAVISLSAFPLDDIWHRIFGQDVTLYGPDSPAALRRSRAVGARRPRADDRGPARPRGAGGGPGGARHAAACSWRGLRGSLPDRALHLPGRVRLRGPAVQARAASGAPDDRGVGGARDRARVLRQGRRAGGGRLLHPDPRRAVPARDADVRAHRPSLPALPRRGGGRRAGRPARGSAPGRPVRADRGRRDRNDRAGRRVGVVVHLVDDRVAGEPPAGGRDRGLRRGDGRRRAGSADRERRLRGRAARARVAGCPAPSRPRR